MTDLGMQVVLYQVNCRTMFTTAEKAECVLWLAEFKSVKRVQRRFQTDKGRNPPARNSILHWHKQFRETGTVESQQGKAKKSRISDDDIERVRTAFARSPIWIFFYGFTEGQETRYVKFSYVYNSRQVSKSKFSDFTGPESVEKYHHKRRQS
ncbi:hypothetical protein C0J52_23409 [Blattella germanica]|nr:hypothetical protein C0J52_23409 [Blattella germanica]